jgi:hypothetical protein
LNAADFADQLGFEGYAGRHPGVGEHIAAVTGGGIGGEYNGIVFGHEGVKAVGRPGAVGGGCGEGEDVVVAEKFRYAGIHLKENLGAKVRRQKT